MNAIQVNEADLRLLRVLGAILETNEVARAAELLGVTPSAVSHSLRLLRRRFNDPLFVRSRGRLQPTPLASALQPTLRCGMSKLAEVLAQELSFDPARSVRTFSLAIPDHPLFTTLPAIVAEIRRTAPGLNIRLRAIETTTREQLASGAVDLILAGAELEASLGLDKELMRSLISSERLLCVMRRDHPAARSKRLELKTYLAAAHVVVSMTADDRDVVDLVLAQSGQSRRVAATAPSFMTAAWFAGGSDLIATLPETIAQRAVDRLDVVMRDPPLRLPVSTSYLWWRPRVQQDPGHAWWRKTLLDAFAPYRR